ncbi:MAG: hypothetical protein AAGB15_02030 [Pseudomonadota bacterium]
MALLAAPLAVSALFTVAAFGLAGMSEPDITSVLSVTLESGVAITMLVVGFTLTCGLLGVGALWMMSQRGLLSWAITGCLGGAVFGILFGHLVMGEVQRPLFVVFACMGAAVLLLIRLIAGIQDKPEAT